MLFLFLKSWISFPMARRVPVPKIDVVPPAGGGGRYNHGYNGYNALNIRLVFDSHIEIDVLHTKMAEYKQVKIGKLKLKGSSSGTKSKSKKRKHDRKDEGVEEKDEDAINHGGWWAIKEYGHLRSCTVALQTHKGNFIKARDNGTLVVGEFHEDQSPEVEEMFTLIKLSETKVAFKSGYGKKSISRQY